MAGKKTIAVFGATGAQGGSVVKILLEDATFSVRAVTRDTSSPGAKALQWAGASIVEADLLDEVSLKAAIVDCYGVFAVTNYWDSKIGRNEEDLAVRLATISVESSVAIFVWSSLPNVRRISNGKYACPHFSGKARAWDRIKQLGFQACVAVEAPCYYQNFENLAFSTMMGFGKSSTGVAEARFPFLGASDYICCFDVNNYGLAVLPVFKSPRTYNHKRIVFNSSDFKASTSSLQTTFAHVIGVKAELKDFTYEEVSASFLGKDFADLCLYIKEHVYYSGEPDELDATAVTDAAFTTFQQWLGTSSLKEQFQA